MPKMNLKRISIFVLMMFSLSGLADENIDGRVVSVADGDTLTILDAEFQQHKVRLAGIDAPEKAMPFGQVSKQKLAEICFEKQAEITIVNIDRYGRTVGDVVCDGVHANEEMVKGGYAWVYRHYDRGFEAFYPLEQEAKDAKLGLWSDSEPTPPWEWRRAHRLKD